MSLQVSQVTILTGRFVKELRFLLGTLATLAIATTDASSQNTYTWIRQSNGSWATGSNWLSGSAPPQNDATGTLVFQGYGSPSTTTISATNNIGFGNVFMNHLEFQSFLTGSGGFAIQNNSGNGITIQGSNAEVRQAGMGHFTFNTGTNGLNFNSNTRFAGASGGANAFGLGNFIFTWRCCPNVVLISSRSPSRSSRQRSTSS